MRQRRKRSAAITLVLAGAISGCSEPVPQQDVYQSLADCQRDWGEPEKCQPVRTGTQRASPLHPMQRPSPHPRAHSIPKHFRSLVESSGSVQLIVSAMPTPHGGYDPVR